MEDIKLTEHFKLSEFIKSDTAKAKKIDNTPTDKEIENIKRLCEEVLEPIRKKWGEAIIVTSGYRCKKLNDAVKGAKTSLHMTGSAVDIRCKNKTKNIMLWGLIRTMMEKKEITVRTLVWEYGGHQNPNWIHLDINDNEHSWRENRIIYYYK